MITASSKKYKVVEDCRIMIRAPEVIDESDEERELTNLNWLLRNQNLAWPKTIDGNSEDDLNNTQTAPADNDELEESLNATKRQKLSDFGAPKRGAINKQLNRNLINYAESRKQCTKNAAHSKRPSPAERYDIFINKIKRDLAEYEHSATKYKTDVTEKPPFNYSHIIGMAMLENGRATLQQICAWIESKFAFFRVRKKWNNSIRHNLSLHHCFRNRKREEKGKGGYWELGVDPKKCDRKRIRNRKGAQTKLNPNLETTAATVAHKKMRNDTDLIYGLTDQKPSQKLSNLAGNDVQLESTDQTLNLDINLAFGILSNNVLSSTPPSPPPPAPPHDDAFLYPADELTLALTANSEASFQLQPQYELGTIIISTTTGIVDEPNSAASSASACLNSIKFGCNNMIYAEDEIPTPSQNVIISSHKMDANRDANIALIAPLISTSDINCDYGNYRPYIDGVDESFSYLHGNELNRSEDILDNLLDVCVRDY